MIYLFFTDFWWHFPYAQSSWYIKEMSYIYISHVYLFLDSLFWTIDLFLYLQNPFKNKNYYYQDFMAYLNIWWGESGTSLFPLLFKKHLSHFWFFILPYSSSKFANFFKKSSWSFHWNFKKCIGCSQLLTTTGPEAVRTFNCSQCRALIGQGPGWGLSGRKVHSRKQRASVWDTWSCLPSLPSIPWAYWWFLTLHPSVLLSHQFKAGFLSSCWPSCWEPYTFHYSFSNMFFCPQNKQTNLFINFTVVSCMVTLWNGQGRDDHSGLQKSVIFLKLPRQRKLRWTKIQLPLLF